MLLQGGGALDPADQAVDVKLTIQVGGEITSAGAGDAGGAAASGGGFLTYIIVAVSVIAFALIVAALVVAYICLCSTHPEVAPGSSPQKAAVYDIPAAPTRATHSFEDV